MLDFGRCSQRSFPLQIDRAGTWMNTLEIELFSSLSCDKSSLIFDIKILFLGRDKSQPERQMFLSRFGSQGKEFKIEDPIHRQKDII